MADKIKLTIEGDSTSLKAATNSASTSIANLSAKSRESINSFAKWGAAAGLAGAAVIAGVVNSSRQSIDVLAKKSDQLGLATEKLVAFQHLGELTGVSTESMNSSLERMVKRLGEAAGGMGAARPQLERLNLSAKELVNLSPDQQYQKIADSIKGLNTQSEKAAAVAAIFGREGLALLNTIEAGAEGFKNAEADVMAFGTAISRVDAAKVEEANDSFERVQEALKGVATQLTVQLAPVMKVIADRFVNAARESGGFSDILLAGINASIEAVAFFADVLRGLEVVWKLAEVAARGFFSLTLTGLDELQKAAASALSWIPGVDVAPSDALSEWAEESRQALMMTNDELDKLVSEPMPSTNIKQFFSDVTREAQSAAEEIAATKEIAVAPVTSEDVSEKDQAAAQKAIEINQAKYQKLREMAEEFQLSEEEREILRMERENEQFNIDLELMVERGILVDEALEIQRGARLDAEAIHQNNLNNIKATGLTEAQKFQALSDGQKLISTIETGKKITSSVANQNKIMFKINKALSMASAVAALPGAVIKSFENGGGYPWGLVPAGLMAAAGAAQISTINSSKYTGQAHSGLDQNPAEGTMLLRRDEMVLDPGTSKEVRESARALTGGGVSAAGGVTIGEVHITVTKDPRDMTVAEWAEVIQGNFAGGFRSAVDSLVDLGVQPTEEFA